MFTHLNLIPLAAGGSIPICTETAPRHVQTRTVVLFNNTPYRSSRPTQAPTTLTANRQQQHTLPTLPSIPKAACSLGGKILSQIPKKTPLTAAAAANDTLVCAVD